MYNTMEVMYLGWCKLSARVIREGIHILIVSFPGSCMRAGSIVTLTNPLFDDVFTLHHAPFFQMEKPE